MQPLTERCGWRGVLGTEVETPRARCLKSVKTVCFSSVKTAGHAIRRLCSGFGARSRQGRGRLGGGRVGFKSRQALPGSTGAVGATPALSASRCAGALVPAPRPSWSAVSRGHCLRHTLRGGPARRAVTLDGRGLHLGQRVGLSQTCSLSAAVRPDVQAADGALSEPRHWVPWAWARAAAPWLARRGGLRGIQEMGQEMSPASERQHSPSGLFCWLGVPKMQLLGHAIGLGSGQGL